METIDKFKGKTILAMLQKPTSPQTICFFYSDDPFMVSFVRYRTETGEILDELMITFPEVDEKLERYKENGFKMVENEDISAL